MAEISSSAFAQLVEGRLIGAPDLSLSGVESLEEAGPAQISFLANKRYAGRVSPSRAGLILIHESHDLSGLEDKTLVLVKDPSAAFSKAVDLFASAAPEFTPGIAPSAVLAADAKVATDAHIGANAVIGRGVVIGAGSVIGAGVVIGDFARVGSACLIHPNVVIRERCTVGDRVIIHSCTVVGSDGFGFIPSAKGHTKIPQVGIVAIEDEVEIGANCALDRARFGRTVIGQGTKIDNLVQIAHNVRIGRHCFIVSQVGIAGSSRIGDFVTLAGQVGVAGHLEIGDGSTVMAQSGISTDLPPKSVVLGSPAVPRKDFVRREFQISKIEKLEQELAEIKRLLSERN